MGEPSMSRIRNVFPKMTSGCFSIQPSMTPTAIHRNHSPEALRRLSKATSETETIWPCLARTAVSRKEQPSAKWISRVRSKFSAFANTRHRSKAPNSFALACHPEGKNVTKTCQSSFWFNQVNFFIVPPMGDNYIIIFLPESTLKLALMPPRGEGRPFIPPAELGGILAHFDKKGRCSQLSQLALFTAPVFPPYRHRNC